MEFKTILLTTTNLHYLLIHKNHFSVKIYDCIDHRDSLDHSWLTLLYFSFVLNMIRYTKRFLFYN